MRWIDSALSFRVFKRLFDPIRLLCGGETDQQFAERLTRAIWIANGGSCEIEVNATYLEDLPHEDFSFDESDYEQIMGQPVGTDGDG